MTTTLPTVDQLNAIQAQWMALPINAPQSQKDRVFKLMESLPKTFVSQSGESFVCMHQGMPCSIGTTLERALKQCRVLGGRLDLVWNGDKGAWIHLQSI